MEYFKYIAILLYLTVVGCSDGNTNAETEPRDDLNSSGSNSSERFEQSSSNLNTSSSSIIVSSSSIVEFFSDTGSFTDDRDSRLYKWVKIFDQIWMSENLNYAMDSTRVLCYGDSGSICSQYGQLYSWTVAMDIEYKYSFDRWGNVGINHQGLCPTGWHIPSVDEWLKLITNVNIYLGLDTTFNRGDKYATWNDIEYVFMSDSDLWERNIGRNYSGFCALPGGRKSSFNGFDQLGMQAWFWTSNELDGMYAATVFMYSGDAKRADVDDGMGRGMLMKSNDEAASIRCLKD